VEPSEFAPRPGSVTMPWGHSPLLWASLQRVLRECAGSTGVRVLDCGGGSGSSAVPLAALGAHVTVVDVSIDALGTLVRRAADAGVSDRIQSVQGEAENLIALFPEVRFDVVLAHEVLHNVVNLDGAIAQLAAVTRDGGMASIVVANPVAAVLGRALNGDLIGALQALERAVGGHLSLDTLTQRCASAGLIVESAEGLEVFSELVPGVELERAGARALLAELEAATATSRPYRDIATRLHLMARRDPKARETTLAAAAAPRTAAPAEGS
jgi:S-adenosylmethionine-dependent methyltransferase